MNVPIWASVASGTQGSYSTETTTTVFLSYHHYITNSKKTASILFQLLFLVFFVATKKDYGVRVDVVGRLEKIITLMFVRSVYHS